MGSGGTFVSWMKKTHSGDLPGNLRFSNKIKIVVYGVKNSSNDSIKRTGIKNQKAYHYSNSFDLV
jgi:hypothetical protein